MGSRASREVDFASRSESLAPCEMVNMTLRASTYIEELVIYASIKDSLLELVRNVSQQSHIEASQLRLHMWQCVHPPLIDRPWEDPFRANHIEPCRDEAVQIWPVENPTEVLAALPGLIRHAGPRLVGAAAALLAAGLPVQLVDLTLGRLLGSQLECAPVKAFLLHTELAGKPRASFGHPECFLWASMCTPDGLPLGPRTIQVEATVRFLVDAAGDPLGEQRITFQVPGSTRTSHVAKHAISSVPNSFDEPILQDPGSGYYIITWMAQKQMNAIQHEFVIQEGRFTRRQNGCKAVAEEIHDPDAPFVITLTREVEDSRSRMVTGRPYVNHEECNTSQPITASVVESAGNNAEWSARTVYELLGM